MEREMEREMADEPSQTANVQQRVAAILDGLGGRGAIAAQRLPGRRAADADEALRIHADEVFAAGSLASLPIAVEVLRRADLGQFSLTERIGGVRLAPTNNGAQENDEGDAAPESAAPYEPTIGELCARMLGANDLVAANALLDYVGLGEINETLSRLKLAPTKLARQVTSADAPDARRQNVTCADDMLTLLALIHGRALPGSQRLLAMLASRSASDGSVANMFGEWLPADARLAHCGSAQGGLVHDAGLLTGPGGACAYCILTAGQSDAHVAQAAIGETLRVLWTAWRLG